jgi:hypothetical protein
MPLHLHLIQSGVQVEALQWLKGMQLTQPTTTSCTVAHSRRECGLRVVSAGGLPCPPGFAESYARPACLSCGATGLHINR